MGAGLFVFFSLIAIQGTLLNLGGRRFAERFALVLQILFVVALLQQLLFLPRLGSYVAADLRSVAVDPVLRWVPSFWFLGLYDELGGRAAAGSAELAAAAVIATLATVTIAVVMLAATHGRMMRMALEGREPTRKGARVFYAALGPLVTLVCRGPVARAVFAFSPAHAAAEPFPSAAAVAVPRIRPGGRDRRRQPGRGAARAVGIRPTDGRRHGDPARLPVLHARRAAAADWHSGRTESELDRAAARTGGPAPGDQRRAHRADRRRRAPGIGAWRVQRRRVVGSLAGPRPWNGLPPGRLAAHRAAARQAAEDSLHLHLLARTLAHSALAAVPGGVLELLLHDTRRSISRWSGARAGSSCSSASSWGSSSRCAW